MTTEEFQQLCSIQEMDASYLSTCEPFVCGNDDLDEFFTKDALIYQNRLIGKTYLFTSNENPKVIIAAVTLSNDSIRITNKLKDDAKEEFLNTSELIDKNLKRYPGVLIGRLATNSQFASMGVGSEIMNFIKNWFRFGNKTGCRFLIVDALNNSRTLHFYLSNGFQFLVNDERDEAKYMGIGVGHLPLNTRMMYFDLLKLK